MNSNRKYLNIIGLLFSMLGVAIIFFYGPPQPSFFPYDIITDDNLHRDVLDMRDKYDLYSKIGLGFVFVGFMLQLIATICFGHTNKKTIEKKEEIKTSQDTITTDSKVDNNH
jgi:hypothetical protein